MASFIDMSLDDIIQKKRKDKPRKSTKPVAQPAKMIGPPARPQANKLQISDARNKIISKKRNQIIDARDKLAELAKHKDARLKLDKLRQERLARMHGQARPVLPKRGMHGQSRPMPPSRGKFTRTIQNKERVFGDISRQVAYQPIAGPKNVIRHPLHTKKFLETRSIGTKHMHDNPVRPKPIIRTVENDIEIIDDPMEDDYAPPAKTALAHRTASLDFQIVARNNDAIENRLSRVHRTAAPQRDKSPPRPPSILKKRPMAALRSEQMTQKPEKPSTEYRIIVSNLRNTVTGGDIEELFGDVGAMVESRLVRPGTAEVIYKTQEDAQKAVELYHNRQLDGQPMNCLLVTPRAPAAAQRNASKPALYSTNSNVEPDISTFHKVLFSNL